MREGERETEKGASIYDVHILVGFFDPLLPSLSTKVLLFLYIFAPIIDPLPSLYAWTSYKEAPKWAKRKKWKNVSGGRAPN